VGGVTQNILDIEPFELDQGRNFTRSELLGNAHSVFLGADVVTELFPSVDCLGKKVTVDGQLFTVIGTAKKRGSVFGMSRDNFVKIPITTHEKMFGRRRSVNISVKARDEVDIDEVVDQARVVLRSRHHLRYDEDDDFGVVTSDGINNLWKSLTAALFAIATFVVSISLVVSGIVIMNIMLVAVIERTREIGVRKAVGATDADIRRQFLVESVILSCLGGFLGLIFAFGVSTLIAAATPLPARFPMWAPALAFVICTAVGIFFGVHPARKAAGMDPIEALRAE
jgi:putative ABC transport system permease protein